MTNRTECVGHDEIRRKYNCIDNRNVRVDEMKDENIVDSYGLGKGS